MMIDCMVRTYMSSPQILPIHTRKMVAPAPRTSNLSALLQSAPTIGDVKLVRDSTYALSRLRHLNEAEVITMFTPLVPHPPGSPLARNMDPFEPLGRALPRQVRHVPYRLDIGMTETHVDFLSASGAILIVICSPDNVLEYDPGASDSQSRFAKNILKKVAEDPSLVNVPIVLLVVSNSTKQLHEYGVDDFATLVSLTDYTADALTNAARLLFGK